jgi:ribonucleotide monophosphatase NagD (HAD superfamily)
VFDLGAFVSALEYASNKSAAVIGKPNANLFKLAVRSWTVSKSSVYVVGDDLDGDVLGAQNAGMKSILVKTGKFREENLENSKIVPDYIINSIADLSGLIQLG